MNSIGSAAGYCTIHKMDKMFVGLEDATEPTCVRCVADATPKMGRTQTVEDPGDGYFTKGEKTDAKITVVSTSNKTSAVKLETPKVILSERAPLADYVHQAIAILSQAPMPKDIKQFKSLQKALTILESLVENTNG